MVKIVFETTDDELIEMYEDYLFLKYYKEHVINDIYNNVIKHNTNKEKEFFIKFYNPIEYNRFKNLSHKYLFEESIEDYGFVFEKGEFDPSYITYFIFEMKNYLIWKVNKMKKLAKNN